MSQKRKHSELSGSSALSAASTEPGPSTDADGDTGESSDVVEVSQPVKKKRNSRRTKDAFNERWKTHERSNEQVLKEQMATWKSQVYDHFKTPTISVVGDTVKYQFVCKRNPHVCLSRARTDDSTTNLKRHFDSCEGKLAPREQRIEEFAHGSTYDKSRFRFVLSMWCARRHRPYVIVQDPELLRAFRMLYAKVEVPHPSTISRDVLEISGLSRKNLAAILQAHKGRLHLCIDGWTSPNVFSFLGVTVSRVVDGRIQSCILDFIKLTQGHTGEYLANRLRECLKDYGIEKKILAITCDNASNNDTLVAELELSGGANSERTRVRCFAHVWNLVVKAMLRLFMKSKAKSKTGRASASFNDDDEGQDDEDDAADAVEDSDANESEEDGDGADNANSDEEGTEDEQDDASGGPALRTSSEEDDDQELDADREAADERTIDEVIEALDKSFLLTADETRIGRGSVTKLTKLAKHIFHSPTLRHDLTACCRRAKIKPRQLVRSVATRWNSLAQAIERAIYLKDALDALFQLTKYNTTGPKGLRKYKLSAEEWNILCQLWPILNFFLRATERISTKGSPLLYDVIPLIDKLTLQLEKAVKDCTLAKVIRVAAARGLGVLNKYYSKTDDSIMYRLTMILHPKYKTEYFRLHEWPEDWIAVAKQLLREHWENHYKTGAKDNVSKQTGSTPAVDDLFADIDNFGQELASDVLDMYLSTPQLPNVGDPLLYWQSQLAGGDPLAQMALDVLSAPASSVDVERAFSRGGLTVSKRRHALSDESVRAATVLSSWASFEGIIDEDKIVQVFRDKKRRIKKAEIPNTYIEISGDEM